MTKLSYKERARQLREREILKTAARLIRDNGFINLNMDDLAEAVGISKPTLYQHFKGKDDMVARAMLLSIQSLETFMDEMQTPTALDGLEAIMRYMLESHADPDGFSVALMRDASVAMKHLTEAPPSMRETQIRVNQKVTALVEQAKDEGSIRADMPNVVIIGMMFSSMYIVQGPSIMRDYSADMEHIINQTVLFFHQGVQTPCGN